MWNYNLAVLLQHVHIVIVCTHLGALQPVLKLLNLDKMFLIFVFNLLDTPVFLESWVPVASNTAINGEN